MSTREKFTFGGQKNVRANRFDRVLWRFSETASRRNGYGRQVAARAAGARSFTWQPEDFLKQVSSMQ